MSDSRIITDFYSLCIIICYLLFIFMAALWNRASRHIFILCIGFFFLLLLSLACSQPSQSGCLPYFHMSHNVVNFGPLTAEIGLTVWGTPANFNGFRVLSSLLLNGSQPNFARCLIVSCAGALYIHFWGSCAVTEFCQEQNSVCVQVLRSPILAALLHGTRVLGVSQTLRH